MHRTLKFVKYLPHYDWQPFILTTHERYHDKKDFTMLSEIPECAKVYRTVIFSPFRVFMKSLAFFKTKMQKRKKSVSSKSTASTRATISNLGLTCQPR